MRRRGHFGAAAALTAGLVLAGPWAVLAQTSGEETTEQVLEVAPSRFGELADEAADVSDGQEPDADGVAPSRFGEQPADEAFGAFQRGLYLTARNLALPRAEAGDAAAQTLLAEIHARGLGVPRDPDEAAKWYRLAAEQGVPEAQLQYALILLARDEGAESKEKARELMRAAADAGSGNAQFNYAQMLIDERPGSRSMAEAYPYFLSAAEKGIADAQYAVSQILANGTAGIAKDEAEARKWLTRAARQNFDTAQYDLGNWYLHGIGGERDLERAFAWTIRAARAGNVAAQGAVAKLYWGGLGTEPDEAEAAAWVVVTRRAGLRDRALDDFWEGLTEEERRAAIERANTLR